jgi:uncharacterized protein (TIGR00369 family)
MTQNPSASTSAVGASAADLPTLRQALAQVFAPWVGQLDLQLLQAQAGQVTLQLPVTPLHVHVGGVLCGQTMMAACDTAMVLAVMTHTGAFKPMTTVQLQTSFLRPVAGDSGHALVVARVLRLGRNLVFGEVEVQDAQGRLAAHATCTCALL